MGQRESPQTNPLSTILACAPSERDTPALCEFLESAGISTQVCGTIDELCTALCEIPRVALLTEEALAGDALGRLSAAFATQPPWSDVSVLMLCAARTGPQPDRRALYLMESLPNATLITRPVHPVTLLSAARAALRVHRRLYEAHRQHEQARSRESAPPEGEPAEPAPRTGESRFHAALGAAPVVVFELDRELRYTWMHNAFSERPAQECVGRRPRELLLRHEEAEAFEAFVRQVIDTGERGRRRFRFTLPDARRDFDIFAEPLRDEDGRTIGVIGAALYVTEYIERQEGLRRQVDELAHADRKKNEFIVQLAHELRGPLAPIHNAAHVLRIQPEPPDPVHYRWAVDVIGRQVAHMTRLIDDLLDMAHIARGGVVLRKELSELGQALAQALETVRPLTAARKQTVTYHASPEPLYVHADPTRLVQIVGNLLSNAAQYTPNGGHITLAARAENDEAVIVVADDGVGIATDALPRIFEPFYRGELSSTQVPVGLGIGLAVVHHLVTLHSGSVRVHSAGPEQGSEFVVRLPMHGVSRAAAADRGAAPSQAVGGSRILVVDDDADVAQSFVLLLELMGHQARAASDGASALAAAPAFRPQVMFVDIALPDMDGFALARTLRAQYSPTELRLVALSGYARDDILERTAAAGFDTHLLKPATAETVEQLLASFDVTR